MHSLASHDNGTIQEHLSYLSSSCGTSIIRLWGTPDRASPQKLKTVLDIAQNNGIKVIIALADYSNSSGDILPANIQSDPTSWYASGYQQYYLPHVENLVRTLGNHPALFAYELANEPHCGGQSSCPPAYNSWVAHVSSVIHSINSSAQISIGQMASQPGTLGDTPQNGDYQNSNSASDITLTSAHFYNDAEKDSALQALSQAQALGKPFYVGEAPTRCLETPDCRLESTSLPPVNINSANPAQPGEALHPLDKHHDNYPPSQQYVTVCTYQTTAEQQYDVDQNARDENGNPISRTVDSVNQQIEEDKYASKFSRYLTIYFKPITNFLASKTELHQAFTSFSQDQYISSAYKSTPDKNQKIFKDNLISEAQTGQLLNEQIAWDCDSGCYSLNCGKPDGSCLPVYLSDTSHPCHALAYPYLNLTAAGSLNSKVIATDDNGQTVHDRMLPNAAIHLDTAVVQQMLPASHQNSPVKICQTVERSSVEDNTNPLQFNFFKRLAEAFQIFHSQKVSAPVDIEEQYDPRLKEGIETQTNFAASFIPASDQESADSPGSATSGDIDLKSPGGGLPQKTFEKFAKMLHPASWQF